MGIRSGLKKLFTDWVSLFSIICSIVFLYCYLHYRSLEMFDKISVINFVYCILAVLCLAVDRAKKYLNEVQAKTIAFSFTVTPAAAALIDMIFDTPNWHNANLAMFFIIAISWLAVWTIIYLVLDSWKKF
ncbi:hypothetical protein V462_11535 [Pantoea ananatis 15320]|uniref:hypothetical protein n=1 Tax=Pantoea ananas TaxID=553 RepID=UPI001EE57595|nr:hypothetical protein [Pantoea ananatis]PKC35780.1 hypothetical protein V462_11535 [Pantoea ananatis 15320]